MFLYARVSTDDKGQDPETQMAALRAANGPGAVECVERAPAGAGSRRPVFERVLREARGGDQVVVWKLDRFARSARDAYNVLAGLTERGVKFRSLTEGFDTSTPMGKAMFGIAAVFAELEHDHISERVRAGMRRARAQGRPIGWRKGRKRGRMSAAHRRAISEARRRGGTER